MEALAVDALPGALGTMRSPEDVVLCAKADMFMLVPAQEGACAVGLGPRTLAWR